MTRASIFQNSNVFIVSFVFVFHVSCLTPHEGRRHFKFLKKKGPVLEVAPGEGFRNEFRKKKERNGGGGHGVEGVAPRLNFKLDFIYNSILLRLPSKK